MGWGCRQAGAPRGPTPGVTAGQFGDPCRAVLFACCESRGLAGSCQSCVGRPGFSAPSPASSRLRLRSGCSRAVCSALLLPEAAGFCREKGFQPGARLRAGHLCLCESHVGRMCVPLLCPFSDLLKAASAPTEQTPRHRSGASAASRVVPVWRCCMLCFGHSDCFSSAGYQSGCLFGEPWALLTALGCF